MPVDINYHSMGLAIEYIIGGLPLNVGFRKSTLVRKLLVEFYLMAYHLVSR